MAMSEMQAPLEPEALPDRLRVFIGHQADARAIELRVTTDPPGALEDAQRLAQDAKEHKRLANWHRRRAAVAWSSFSEFKARLEALGVQVVIEESTDQ